MSENPGGDFLTHTEDAVRKCFALDRKITAKLKIERPSTQECSELGSRAYSRLIGSRPLTRDDWRKNKRQFHADEIFMVKSADIREGQPAANLRNRSTKTGVSDDWPPLNFRHYWRPNKPESGCLFGAVAYQDVDYVWWRVTVVRTIQTFLKRNAAFSSWTEGEALSTARKARI